MIEPIKNNFGMYRTWNRLTGIMLTQSSNRRAVLGLAILATAALARAEDPPPAATELHAARVKVVDGQGQPVADAHVEMTDRALAAKWLGKVPGAVISQTSAADGTVTLRLPAEARQNPIAAFKSGVGLDYSSIPLPTDGEPRGSWPDEIRLTLARARTVKLKAVDPKQKALTGIVFSVGKLAVPEKIRYVGDDHVPYGIDLTGCEGTTATSDADGMATFNWLPQEFLDRIRFNLVSQWFSSTHPPGLTPGLPDLMQKNPDELLTVELTSRTPITGKVTFADGRPAANIQIVAHVVTHHAESHGSGALTKADGSYEMLLESDRLSMIFVKDASWTAPAYDRVLAQESPISGVDFVLAKGTMVRVTATEGTDQRPVAGMSLCVKQMAKRPAGEESKDSDSNGHMFPDYYWYSWSLWTDRAGKTQLTLGPGTYKIGGQVLPGETVVIDGQEEIDFPLHFPSKNVVPLAGKLLDADKRPVAGVVVSGVYTGHGGAPLHFDQTAITGDDGSFELQREPTALTLQAKSADGKFAAVAETYEIQKRMTFRLQPVIKVQGRLVDRQGNPIATGKLEYGLSMDRDAGRFRFALHGETTPDADGRFTLDGLLFHPGPLHVADVVVNYWADAQAKIDPQRQCLGWRWAAHDQGYVELTNIRPTKDAKTIELGDIKVPK
jgi:hypothetical protein